MDLFFTNIAYASVGSFVKNVNKFILNSFIVLLFALAVVYFLYGIFEFISNQDNEEKRKVGKSHMLWGIVGITIMMSVWVILGIVLRTFNISGINPEMGIVQLNDYNPGYPQLTVSGGIGGQNTTDNNSSNLVEAIYYNPLGNHSPLTYTVTDDTCTNPDQQTGFNFKKYLMPTRVLASEEIIDGILYTDDINDPNLKKYEEQLYLYNLTQGDNFAAVFNKIRNKIADEVYPNEGIHLTKYINESGIGYFGSSIEYSTTSDVGQYDFSLFELFKPGESPNDYAMEVERLDRFLSFSSTQDPNFYSPINLMNLLIGNPSQSVTLELFKKYKPLSYRNIKYYTGFFPGNSFSGNNNVYIAPNNTEIEDHINRTLIQSIYPTLVNSYIDNVIAFRRQNPVFVKKGTTEQQGVYHNLAFNDVDGFRQAAISSLDGLRRVFYPVYGEPACVIKYKPWDGYHRAPAPGFPNVNIVYDISGQDWQPIFYENIHGTQIPYGDINGITACFQYPNIPHTPSCPN